MVYMPVFMVHRMAATFVDDDDNQQQPHLNKQGRERGETGVSGRGTQSGRRPELSVMN